MSRLERESEGDFLSFFSGKFPPFRKWNTNGKHQEPSLHLKLGKRGAIWQFWDIFALFNLLKLVATGDRNPWVLSQYARFWRQTNWDKEGVHMTLIFGGGILERTDLALKPRDLGLFSSKEKKVVSIKILEKFFKAGNIKEGGILGQFCCPPSFIFQIRLGKNFPSPPTQWCNAHTVTQRNSTKMYCISLFYSFLVRAEIEDQNQNHKVGSESLSGGKTQKRWGNFCRIKLFWNKTFEKGKSLLRQDFIFPLLSQQHL